MPVVPFCDTCLRESYSVHEAVTVLEVITRGGLVGYLCTCQQHLKETREKILLEAVRGNFRTVREATTEKLWNNWIQIWPRPRKRRTRFG